MATHSHQPLNPSAAVFIPSPSYHYTVMNQPRFDVLCRYHIHESGNHCRYGLGCRYVHAQELHRPSLGEQTATLLLAVHSLILFAVSCFNQTQATTPTAFAAQQNSDEPEEHADLHRAKSHPQSKDARGVHVDAADARSKMSIMVPTTTIDSAEDYDDDDDDDAKDANNAEPVNNRGDVNVDSEYDTLGFEDMLQADVELRHDAPQPLSDVDIESNNLNLLAPDMAPQQLLLCKFLWANSPKHLQSKVHPRLLPTTYPNIFLCTGKATDGVDEPIFENAVLRGLKATQYNGCPIQINRFNEQRQRYEVSLIGDPDKTFKQLLIQDHNIHVINPLNIAMAFSDFENHLNGDVEKLELLKTDPSDWTIFGAFLDFQLPPSAQHKELSECFSWVDVRYIFTAKCRDHNLAITKEHCPQIISLLYSFCSLSAQPFLYIWKKYLIPTSWTLVEWPYFHELWVYTDQSFIPLALAGKSPDD